MIHIDVEVRKNHFQDLARIDWTPAYARTAAYFAREISIMFETSGASRGHKWRELAPATLREKLRAGKASDILVRNGTLRASFRALRLNQDGLVFGTDVTTAKYHDSDKPRQQKADGGPRLPRRSLIRLLDRDADAVAREFVREIHDKAGGGPA